MKENKMRIWGEKRLETVDPMEISTSDNIT